MGFHFSSSGSSGGSKIGLTIFGTFFAGIGGLFIFLMALSLIETVDRYVSWEPTTATVTASRIDEDEGSESPYATFVDVRYTWDGREFEKSLESVESFGDYDDAEASLSNFQQGSEVQVWVNPEAPAEVVLERGDFWVLPFMLLPLIFVVIGVGTIRSAWRRKSEASATKMPNGKWVKVGLPVLFAIFGIVGVVGFYFLGVCPWLEYSEAQQWKEVPCTVESSCVRTHSDDDGDTYSVDILYRYEYEGKTYRSNRYSFVGCSSSGYEGKREVVDRHPEGTQTVCYVDPNDADRAVLVRDFTWSLLLGLFFLPFLLVGVGGCIGIAIHRRRKQRRLDRITHLSPEAPRSQTLQAMDWLPKFQGIGPMELTPKTSRRMKVAGVIFFAVFWNAITGVFVSSVIDGHLEGDPNWFLTIFMVPFVLIGLGIVVAVIHQLLAAFNPTLLLTVSSDALSGGETLDISWNLLGRAYRVNRLTIDLACEEETRYQRGTDTMCDTETMASYRLVDTAEPLEIAAGRASFVVPPEAMHSFAASSNKILWKLRVKGSVSRWPDVKDDYPVVILPVEMGGEL